MTNSTLIATVSTAAITAALAPHIPPATEFLTEEFIFEQTARHIFKQGKRSYCIEDGCLYRGPNGTKCAVGLWLTDEEAELAGEQAGIEDLLARDKLPARLVPFKDLLAGLQSVHDGEHWQDSDKMRRALEIVARARGIKLVGWMFSLSFKNRELPPPTNSNFDSYY